MDILLNSRKDFDPTLYFILDPACCGGRDPLFVLEQALLGGVTLVQYRNKGGDMDAIRREAAACFALCHAADVPLLVNDYVDIAVEIGADGAHIGQGDLSPKSAREMLGADKILGLTAFTAEQLDMVDPALVDYVGTGPVFPTLTDKGKPVLGVEGFEILAAMSPVPVVAIGGITPECAMEITLAGAAGLAVMRSIGAADDVEAAVRAFQSVL